MATLPTDAAISLPVVTSAASGSRPSKLEEEVVALFEQHRSPLLRYLLSFRIAAPDAEEIVQEVFLSLFQHLRRGKSRANLHGWLFRVAHNLALKNRIRAQRQQTILSLQFLQPLFGTRRAIAMSATRRIIFLCSRQPIPATPHCS